MAEIRLNAEKKVATLTPRERDIALSLLSGRSNKSTAYELGISVRTVEMHRAHIMAKLNAKSLADAAILLIQAGVAPAPLDHQQARREEALRSCLFGGSSGAAFRLGRRLPAPVSTSEAGSKALPDRRLSAARGNRPGC